MPFHTNFNTGFLREVHPTGEGEGMVYLVGMTVSPTR